MTLIERFGMRVPGGVLAILGLCVSMAVVAQDAAFDSHDLAGIWVLVFKPDGQAPFGPDRPALTPAGEARYLGNIPTAVEADPYRPPSDAPTESNDPALACNPIGFPRTFYDEVIRTFEIVHVDDRILQLLQRRRTLRELWMDGRELPRGENLENLGPSWYGHSVAEWQGDELVINTVGMDDRAWLDTVGHPKSFEARIEERMRRVDADTLEIRMTLYDPVYYTAPWEARVLRFSREPAERVTYFGWYGIYSGVTDLMCAPLNFLELRRDGAY